MSKYILLVALAVVVLVSIAGCRSYGYKPYYGGGPHLNCMPEQTFPIMIIHKPVPWEELKEVYPPELNISSK
jgi:hypothetical protein